MRRSAKRKRFPTLYSGSWMDQSASFNPRMASRSWSEDIYISNYGYWNITGRGR